LNGLINNEVQTIIEDHEDNIWLGTLEGLVLRNENLYQDFNEEEGLMNLRIHSLAESHEGDIWIGTFGGGIYMLPSDTEPLQIKEVPGNQLLTSGNIYSLVWEDQNILLAGTEAGFDRILISGDSIKKVVHFDDADGFIEGSNNLNAVLCDSDKQFWFGTSAGLIAYDPSQKLDYSKAPLTYIVDLRLNFLEQDWSANYQVTNFSHLPENLVLPHKQNHLTFDFTAIHYDSPDNLKFSYFLEGHSKSWSPFSTERSATFQELSPGEYRFRLISRSKYGVEGKEVSYDFTIKPPFWFTIWFLVLSISMFFVLVLLIFRYRTRKLRNENIKLERTVELRTWAIKQQKEQIEEQRDKVISQQNQITDSIQYAQQIQTAILPEVELLNDYFQDSFIMLRPLNIVSGDFYWIGKKNDHLVFSAVDCTGHGVPGAFMSMLGISFLNKIINENGIVMPSEILNLLRKNILDVFHQTEEVEKGNRDGMDIALCSYDIKNEKLYFAGAMNPLYQIRNEKDGFKLIEHRPDKMPIAIYSIMDPFKQQEIELRKGDSLYLFSDGFCDQFGGSNRKKFMKKHFREMLLSHQNISMSDQYQAYQKILKDWMNPPDDTSISHEQTDDILVMGIKL
jgi:serine phosphatase RsbU (regulator of sigma subunit)